MSKEYNVKFICPWNGRQMRSMEVSESSIYMAESGEIVYRYNDHYNACEVVEVEEVSQAHLDAKAAYFKKYGTACE